MVRGRLHQRQKSRDSHIYQRPFSGGPLCSQHPTQKENPPFTPTTEEGWRNGHRIFTSRCHDGGRWRGGSGQGEDRDPSALTPSRDWSISDGRGLAF